MRYAVAARVVTASDNRAMEIIPKFVKRPMNF